MRLFVAAVPDDETREWIASQQTHFQEVLRPFQRELRWVRAESVHITLTFIGEVAESQPVEDALARCRPANTRLELGGLGLFPGPRRPSVFWMGCVDPEQEIGRLQAEVAHALRSFVEP
jgi:2'-5' RNA ligase